MRWQLWLPLASPRRAARGSQSLQLPPNALLPQRTYKNFVTWSSARKGSGHSSCGHGARKRWNWFRLTPSRLISSAQLLLLGIHSQKIHPPAKRKEHQPDLSAHFPQVLVIGPAPDERHQGRHVVNVTGTPMASEAGSPHCQAVHDHGELQLGDLLVLGAPSIVDCMRDVRDKALSSFLKRTPSKPDDVEASGSCAWLLQRRVTRHGEPLHLALGGLELPSGHEAKHLAQHLKAPPRSLVSAILVECWRAFRA